MLKVNFVGAVNGVSGSCSWLHHTDSDIQFLVDCGAYQGGDEPQRVEKFEDFPFDAEQISFILLTHAHLDHCGLIPTLIEYGFTGKVYATKATKEIVEVMLLDSLKISGMDQCLLKEISWFLIDEQPFKWGKTISLSDGLKFTYLRSSHILGAAHISLSWKTPNSPDSKWKTILFSGDIGVNVDGAEYLPLLKSEHYPFPQTDYMVIESTYGSRNREPTVKSKDNRIAELWKVINNVCINNDGTLLVPAFSLHRTQELICDIWAAIEKNMPPTYDENNKPKRFPWCVHSPLGNKISTIYSDRLFDKTSTGKGMYINESLLQTLGFDDYSKLKDLFEKDNNVSERQILRKIGTNQKSSIKTPEDVIRKRHKIIIASSGMCNAGPVVDYLDLLSDNSNNAIIITGYQAKEANGSSTLTQRMKNSKASIFDFSSYYSAHADQSGLVDFVLNTQNTEQSNCNPVTIFINHGSDDSKAGLKNKLIEGVDLSKRKIKDIYLASSQWFDLDAGTYLPDTSDDTLTLSLDQKIDLLGNELKEIKIMLRRLLRKTTLKK
ncbi:MULTISPECIES: MBL fold metallo-hydrolase [Aeromonas]|uniref:MBL fold metallo-hydrolase n=1 Tax=Aeromonas TaxID=642 RepID=UPI001C211847|nr:MULTISPECIES: MBL fold metallo-hydrolase [Aeromonas]QWZ82017.1 MBL fold metallo-hydrolase [Aeromonas sp. FDAARGOS 1414]